MHTNNETREREREASSSHKKSLQQYERRACSVLPYKTGRVEAANCGDRVGRGRTKQAAGRSGSIKFFSSSTAGAARKGGVFGGVIAVVDPLLAQTSPSFVCVSDIDDRDSPRGTRSQH